ncbi:MAG: hypothetical protein IMZ62_15390 [Chloroflexi bacterium]|nr:hypothetical protein [Chloroflexota bacterium]
MFATGSISGLRSAVKYVGCTRLLGALGIQVYLIAAIAPKEADFGKKQTPLFGPPGSLIPRLNVNSD